MKNIKSSIRESNKLNPNGLNWINASIVFIPIIIVLIQQIILTFFSQKGIPFTESELNNHFFFEASKRLDLLSISYVYFIICFFVSFKIAFDIRTLSSEDGKEKLKAGALLLFSVSFWVGYNSIFGKDFLNISIIGEDWFKTALGGSKNCLDEKIKQVCFNWGYKKFTYLLDISAIITVFTIPFLILGTVSCLDTIPNLNEQENWKFQTHRFKNYIFGCSAVLIFGVIFFKTWTSYPSVSFASSEYKTIRLGLEALSNSMTMLTGLTYTLVFASFAVPVGYILNRRADELITQTIGSKSYSPKVFSTVAKARESSDLKFTTMELVQSIFALLAPLLTGAFSSMVGSLS